MRSSIKSCHCIGCDALLDDGYLVPQRHIVGVLPSLNNDDGDDDKKKKKKRLRVQRIRKGRRRKRNGMYIN